MDLRKAVAPFSAFSEPFRVDRAKGLRLARLDPGETLGIGTETKGAAREALAGGVALLSELQERLYEQGHWAVLVILQGMDASGKDGAIKHVMSGVNPQGCRVWSFKAPAGEELQHDYLWRCVRRLPERGMIGLFNRSYYEEVVTARVHPENLERQGLPPECITPRVWADRCEDIRAFERYLHRNGVLVRKFFLNVSREEQRRRLLERINDPAKQWKFSMGDIDDRRRWKDYMHAYEDAIRATATAESPWHVVPADNKWFARIVVAAGVIDAIGSLRLDRRRTPGARLRELAKARAALARERAGK